ncbi:MAG: prepilin peptidase [Candidatus Diapherotrites archaeon]|nr:prepilin peptidase [Candidatus Diapherotrites archaeon]
MFGLLYTVIAIAGLAYASYTDIKQRIVSNELVLLLLVSGVVLHAIESFATRSIMPLLFSLAASIMMFLFSYALWRIGAWAGGDVKLFTALAALLPMPFVGSVPSFYFIFPVFPFLILINSVILSFPFIMLYVIWKTMRKRDLKKRFKGILRDTGIHTIIYACSIIGFSFVLNLMGINSILLIPILAGITFLPRAMKIGVPVMLTFISLVYSFDIAHGAYIFVSTFIFILFFEIVSYGRRYALRDRVATDKLEDGMIPAQTLYIDKGKVKVYAPSLLERILHPLHEPKHVIISEHRAAGIEAKDIKKLKKYGVKSIWVKDSVPMIPIVLLGTIASLFIGDLIWLITTWV